MVHRAVIFVPLLTIWLVTLLMPSAQASNACQHADGALGVSRIIEIDTRNGPLYGDITKYLKEDDFLDAKEVVLTFDDGPLPRVTRSILDTLDRFCTKATFFSVGRMALAYPDTTKEIMARGHTLGGHTWSHPMNLRRMNLAKAVDQIEKGFSAITLAAEQPIAPFFRFPGLSDSDPLLRHLQERGIATFTVDVVSNDSYIHNSGNLARYTLRKLEARQRGIMLFHDIKPATAKALPTILRELKARDYKIVHLRAKVPLTPQADHDEDLRAILAKARPTNKTDEPQRDGLTNGETAPEADEVHRKQNPDVTRLAPPPRERSATPAGAPSRASSSATRPRAAKQKRRADNYDWPRSYRNASPPASLWFN